MVGKQAEGNLDLLPGGANPGAAEYMVGVKKFASKSFVLLTIVSSITALLLIGCSDQRSQYRGRQVQSAQSQSAEPTPWAVSIPTALPDFAASASRFVDQAKGAVAGAIPTLQPAQPTQSAPSAPVYAPPAQFEPAETPVPTDAPIPTVEPQPVVLEVLPPLSGIDESIQPCAVNPQDEYEWANACPGVRRP